MNRPAACDRVCQANSVTMDMAGFGAGNKQYSLGFIHSYCCSEVWVGNDMCGEWRLGKLHAQKIFHYSDRTQQFGDIPLVGSEQAQHKANIPILSSLQIRSAVPPL